MVFSWRRLIASPASPFTSTERLVAHVLAMYMSEAGDSCFPSIPTIAADAALADSTVRDALNRMSEWGFLDRVRRRGRGRSNEYLARIPDYFDEQEPAEENRRRAVVFASGHEQLAVGPAVKPVPEASPDASEKTADTRRFSEGENRRLADGKPPTDASKTAATRRQLVQEGSRRNSPLTPADAGEGERGEGSLRYQLELAVTAELGVTPATRSEKRDWENVLAQLEEIGATAAEIQERCAAFRETWPQAALRPLALVRHWAFLGGKVELQQPGASIDRWVEATGWRMPDDVAREVLLSRDLPEALVERHVERCRALRDAHQAAEHATVGAIAQARRVA